MGARMYLHVVPRTQQERGKTRAVLVAFAVGRRSPSTSKRPFDQLLDWCSHGLVTGSRNHVRTRTVRVLAGDEVRPSRVLWPLAPKHPGRLRQGGIWSPVLYVVYSAPR
jgi:hypothetical protein